MLTTHLAQVVYIYSFFGILTTQPEPSPVPTPRGAAVPSSGLERLSSGPPHSPQPQLCCGLYELGRHQRPLAPNQMSPHGGPWVPLQILLPPLGLTTVKCLPLYILLIN